MITCIFLLILIIGDCDDGDGDQNYEVMLKFNLNILELNNATTNGGWWQIDAFGDYSSVKHLCMIWQWQWW